MVAKITQKWLVVALSPLRPDGRVPHKVSGHNQANSPLIINRGLGAAKKTECRLYLEGPRGGKIDLVLEELTKPKKLVFCLGKKSTIEK